MKKEKKEFRALKKNVIRYNKVLIAIFVIFMVYALIHSVSIQDCSGIDFYNQSEEVTSEMLTCTNMSTDLLAFFTNYELVIASILLVIALVFLVLQKLNLLKINEIDGVEEYENEKVNKNIHVITTLLLGYTGFHKFKTENKKIGWIYLVNFILFVVSFIIKMFFVSTYESYLIFYCTYEFSSLFLIGIIIMNIVEAIFSLISAKDDNGMIFA